MVPKYADRVESVQSVIAARLIDALAAQHKVQPLHVALHVPGLCHAHDPRRSLAADCAYCARRGNCFAPNGGGADTDMAGGAGGLPDLIKKFQLPIFELLVDFGDEILDAVAAARGIPVEDVRGTHVEPLRAWLRETHPPGPAPGDAEDGDGDVLAPTPMLGGRDPALGGGGGGELMDVTNNCVA